MAAESSTAAHPSLASSWENPKQAYDDWAKSYTETLRQWGYKLPEVAGGTLAKFLKPAQQDGSPSLICDLGAGNGLVGKELKRQGFTSIIGCDLSPGMLAEAQKENIYNEVREVDLSKPLEFPSDSFHATVCVGTTTYVTSTAKETVQEMVRVVKKGGLVLMTHKTSVEPVFLPVHEELCKSGVWKEVLVSDPMDYLPCHAESEEASKDVAKEMVKIFIFEKL